MPRTKSTTRRASKEKSIRRQRRKLSKAIEWKSWYARIFSSALYPEPTLDIIRVFQHQAILYRHIVKE